MDLEKFKQMLTDNRLENLRILCPNCHSQTETYCGAKKKKKQRGKYYCQHCGKEKKTNSKLCPQCIRIIYPAKEKIEWPSNEELRDRLKNTSYRQLGRELGVSDNAIRKRLR